MNRTDPVSLYNFSDLLPDGSLRSPLCHTQDGRLIRITGWHIVFDISPVIQYRLHHRSTFSPEEYFLLSLLMHTTPATTSTIPCTPYKIELREFAFCGTVISAKPSNEITEFIPISLHNLLFHRNSTKNLKVYSIYCVSLFHQNCSGILIEKWKHFLSFLLHSLVFWFKCEIRVQLIVYMYCYFKKCSNIDLWVLVFALTLIHCLHERCAIIAVMWETDKVYNIVDSKVLTCVWCCYIIFQWNFHTPGCITHLWHQTRGLHTFVGSMWHRRYLLDRPASGSQSP